MRRPMPIEFVLPAWPYNRGWKPLLDTAAPVTSTALLPPGAKRVVAARSVQVFGGES